MRHRLWIIILLVAWLGQWEIGEREILPAPMLSGWAEPSPVTSLVNGGSELVPTSYEGRSDWVVWLRWEELVVLIAA